jgi:hypothetical protein
MVRPGAPGGRLRSAAGGPRPRPRGDSPLLRAANTARRARRGLGLLNEIDHDTTGIFLRANRDLLHNIAANHPSWWVMRIGLLIATLAACLAALAASGPAADARPMLIADGAYSPASATGGRYTAFLVGPRRIRVLDTLSETTYETAVPSTCADPIDLAGVGGDQALVNCTDRPEISLHDEPLLLDLVRRNWHVPVGADTFLKRLRRDDTSARFDAVGLRWLGGEWTQYQGYGRVFLDWRTGLTVEGDGDRTVMPDLDAADVLAPLCNPFGRRRRQPTYEGQAFLDFPYDPPYRIVGNELQHCGTSQPAVQLETKEQAVGMSLSDGYASWYVLGRRSSLRAYLPICGVRFSWPLSHVVAVVHTTRAIFATTSSDGTLGHPLRIARQARPECPDVTRPDALMIARDHRYAAPSLIAAHWPRAHDGTPILLAPHEHGSAPLSGRKGRVHLRTTMKLRRARWRIGDGPWKNATGDGRAWTLGFVHAGVLEISVRTDDGTTARYAVRVR